MTRRDCKSCDFFECCVGLPYGICHRYPPSGKMKQNLTSLSGWCGEHKEKKEEKNEVNK